MMVMNNAVANERGGYNPGYGQNVGYSVYVLTCGDREGLFQGIREAAGRSCCF